MEHGAWQANPCPPSDTLTTLQPCCLLSPSSPPNTHKPQALHPLSLLPWALTQDVCAAFTPQVTLSQKPSLATLCINSSSDP